MIEPVRSLLIPRRCFSGGTALLQGITRSHIPFKRPETHSLGSGGVLSFKNLDELVKSRKLYDHRFMSETLKKNGFILVKKITPRNSGNRTLSQKGAKVFLCVQEGTNTFKAVKVVPNNNTAVAQSDAVTLRANVEQSISALLSKRVPTKSFRVKRESFGAINPKKIEKDLEVLRNAQAKVSTTHVDHILGSSIKSLDVMQSEKTSKNTLPTLESRKEISEKKRILKLLNRTSTENEVLRKLYSFPFISNMKGYFKDNSFQYMVFSFFQGGTLRDLLNEHGGKLEEEHAKFLAAELLLSIEYLQRNDVVHRDIKPENILIDKEGHIGLTDFGMSTRLKYGNKNIAGTVEYIPYEVLTETKFSSRYIDYWAFGVVLFRMLAGHTPFSRNSLTGEQATSAKDIFCNILTSRVVYPDHFSEEAKDLLSHVLTRDYAKRIKGKNIRNHPFFENTDLLSIRKKIISPPLKPTLTAVVEREKNAQPLNVRQVQKLALDKHQQESIEPMNDVIYKRRRQKPEFDLSFE